MPLEALRAGTVRGRRIGAAVLAVLAVAALVAGVLAARGGSSGPPIATAAARLVPASAVAYVHVSTDGTRDAVADARRAAQGFPGYAALRDSVLERLSVTGGRDQVSGWIGDEMALALLGSDSGTAGSLVLLSVRDMAKARSFEARGARRSGPSKRYRGVRIDRYGALDAAFIGDFLVLGQAPALHQAIDLQQGRGTALAADPTFAKLAKGLSDDRVADAYATSDGLRRLLAPAGGVLGAAGVLLDRPDLKGVALSVSAQDPGARMTIVSDVPGRKAQAFDPELLGAVPKGAMAYYGTRGLDETVARLLAGTGTSALAGLLKSARRTLGTQGVDSVQRDLLSLLSGETAVAILPGIPRPTLLVIARARDAARTRAALSRLTATLAKLLKGATVSHRGDVTVIRSAESEFDAAVIDGNLVLSTGRAGIDAALDPQGGLSDADAFGAVTGDLDRPVTSVLFLDFGRLLDLGEQTGLNDSRAYLAAKGDLSRIGAVGVRSTGAGEAPTSEVRVQLP